MAGSSDNLRDDVCLQNKLHMQMDVKHHHANCQKSRPQSPQLLLVRLLLPGKSMGWVSHCPFICLTRPDMNFLLSLFFS